MAQPATPQIPAAEIPTPEIDSRALTEAADEFSKSAEVLQDAAKNMERAQKVKPREEPRKNFLEKGADANTQPKNAATTPTSVATL